MNHDLSHHAEEYLRCLNGENIPMNFTDASNGIEELVEKGFARKYGHQNNMAAMTDEGRVLAKKIKRAANGRMPDVTA